MQKEAASAYSKALYLRLHLGTSEQHDKPDRIIGHKVEVRNQKLPRTTNPQTTSVVISK